MRSLIRVLVTAVAGDLGQAIIKALRLSSFSLEIHGCDLEPDSYGAAFVESYHPVPPARAPEYVLALDTLCRNLDLQAVVPASEPEILALGGRCLPCGVPVVSQPREWLGIYADKLATMQALAGQVELGAFADGADLLAVGTLVAQCGFPIVVKARQSSGSRSLRVAQSRAELDMALAATSLPIVQEYLDESGGEFSVGVFRCTDFETAVAFKRKLGATVGLSWQAEVIQSPEVCDYALRVTRAAEAMGSLNVQLRLTSVGPRLLEINPRFSSLVAARAACGFRDVEWSLALALGLPLCSPSEPYRPLHFHRFYHEVVDLGNGFGVLPAWMPRVVLGPEMKE